MPTRRLVVALTVLLFGVFGVGLVTALSRSGDDDGSPSAQPTPSSSVFTQPPLPTTEPTTGPDETTEPTESPTPEPTVSPTGHQVPGPGGPPGPGGTPRMPNTGLPAALAITATATMAAAYGARRLAR